MRLAIMGGTGRIGRLALGIALSQGHEVVALARHSANIRTSAGLAVVTGDLLESRAVLEAVMGVEAVIAAVGPRSNSIVAAGLASTAASPIAPTVRPWQPWIPAAGAALLLIFILASIAELSLLGGAALVAGAGVLIPVWAVMSGRAMSSAGDEDSSRPPSTTT